MNSECWCALALAILSPKAANAELAFSILDRGPMRDNRNLTNEDIKEMADLREKGATWKQIGQIYGLNIHAAYKRVRRFKQKEAAIL